MARAQYVIDEKDKKTAVLLSLKEYQKLLEDLHDLAIVAERKEEKPISLGEFKRRLRKDTASSGFRSIILSQRN